MCAMATMRLIDRVLQTGIRWCMSDIDRVGTKSRAHPTGLHDGVLEITLPVMLQEERARRTVI
jgi:hypothetical protein